MRISYVDVGDGPAILLLHGLGHSTHGWRKVMQPLAEGGYRVMAVDLPGFGYSDKPGGYTLDGYVDFVRNWLDLHVIDRAAVIGNSMGGAIAAAVAGLAAERVSALVLADPGGFGREVTWALRFAGLRVVRAALNRRLTPWKVRHALRWVDADSSLIEDAEVDRIMELDELPGAREALFEIAHNVIGLRGLRPGLGLGDIPTEIDAPTLILWGRRDRVIPVSHAERAHQAIPHSEVVLFDGCGHCPQLEVPDAFSDTVLRFLHVHHPPAVAAER
jgi:4,5:9,10-diseco-3-hydroxy-5,9,17-trioxoandrosta-1(10),2-diene-4-oate hydrolase